MIDKRLKNDLDDFNIEVSNESALGTEKKAEPYKIRGSSRRPPRESISMTWLPVVKQKIMQCYTTFLPIQLVLLRKG